MKRILVLAPHPDDEQALAGALIYTFRNKYDIYVSFLTNGDSLNQNANIRIKEAINALSILGIKEEKIIFLGYGNNWRGGKHIYNLGSEQVVSYSGKTQTYCIEKHPEYAMMRYGTHHVYTRENMHDDIKSLLQDLLADIIICVDYDSHPDHRALSLMFEEVMGEILRNKYLNYSPVVLKKFAYACMLSGRWDYYYEPILETMPPYKEELLDDRYELDNPVYKWQERVQLDVAPETKTRFLHENILLKAAEEYRSQNLRSRVGRYANADIVYWQRRTDSLLYKAKITASSGCSKFVNDFKFFDCDDVLSLERSVNLLSGFVWTPCLDDEEKKLYIDFESYVNISMIHIYENHIIGEDILKAKVSFEGTDDIIIIECIDHAGGKTVVKFPTVFNVKHIEFEIIEHRGTKFGIAELEVYEKTCEQIVPFRHYTQIRNEVVNVENHPDIIDERLVYNFCVDNKRDSLYYKYYKFLLKWDKISIEELELWFINRSYSNVVIYGYGDFGIKLAKDLRKTNLKIVCGIDRMSGTMSAPFPLFHPDMLDKLPDADVIIVTPILHYTEIERMLLNKGFNKSIIVSLETVINESR